jgi:hypothetical protein
VTTAAAALLAVVLGLALSRTGAPSATGRAWSLPSWLPKSTIPVDRVVTANAAHPWLAIEGDTVRADLAHGTTLVTAVGPAVPQSGVFPVPATSPCTFTLTLAGSTGRVPLGAGSFTITDEQGQTHRPLVTVQGGAPLPARVPPGRLLTLTVSAVLPTGNGTLHWAPAGARPLVSWDFDVELD